MFTFLFWVYLMNPDNTDDHGNILTLGFFSDAVSACITVAAILIFKHGI